MTNLVLMMGAPGSGKSTFAKSLLRHDDEYISRDAIRYSMVKENEDYFSKENEVMKVFIQKVDYAIAHCKGDVYADATHLTPSSRGKLLNNLKNKANIVVIYMDTDLETTLAQNDLRTGREKVPKSAVIKMHNSIIMPQKFEGISKVLIVKNGKIEREVRL